MEKRRVRKMKTRPIKKVIHILIYLALAMVIGWTELGYAPITILLRLACGYSLGSITFHIEEFFTYLLGA